MSLFRVDAPQLEESESGLKSVLRSKNPVEKNKYWELVFAYKNLKNIAFWVKIVAENS